MDMLITDSIIFLYPNFEWELGITYTLYLDMMIELLRMSMPL